ncbi:MAG: V-type ATP synthase subunit E [Ruminococcaceae bacterium]|nr:V-type ATP synthase subunit E [Oscillospiraceae bacterium]
MEIQLQELIDRIKKDGVEAAEAESEAIISAAKDEAEKIVARAKEEAEKILSDAKNETERLVRSGEDSLRQAGRNLLISFRESVTRELNVILTENVNSVYSSEDFVQLIRDVVTGFAARSDASDICVVLNSESLAAFERSMLAALKEKLLCSVTLKASDNFDGGFRISVNNGSAYYDYSTESVVEMLSNYLTPRIIKLLKEA